jgi:hypothetical protein
MAFEGRLEHVLILLKRCYWHSRFFLVIR